PGDDLRGLVAGDLALERRHQARALVDRVRDLLVGEPRDPLREVGTAHGAGAVAVVALVAVHVFVDTTIEQSFTGRLVGRGGQLGAGATGDHRGKRSRNGESEQPLAGGRVGHVVLLGTGVRET